MLKRLSVAILLLSVAVAAYGQSEFAKLQAAYNKAVQEYFKPYQTAHTEEETAAIKLDPNKNPGLAYLPKFEALAKRLGKTNDGMQAWLMVIDIAETTQNAKAEDAAIGVVMKNFVDSPSMATFAGRLPYMMYDLPQAQREKKLVTMLDAIEGAAKTDAVKAAALYAKGQVIARDGQGDTAAAAKLYREVSAKYPNTDLGKRAARDVFEMENLVPGKVAPDFTATDQDGKTFKLSDYRGKVVVLDFWGFW